MRRTFLGLAGAGLLALALAASPALAQATAIGTVDMGRVNQEYQTIAQLDTQFRTFVAEQQAKLEARDKTRMLSDAELKEYMDLSQFGAPTEANKQRLTALADASEAREKELAGLEQKTRSADEQKRYDELKAIATARAAELTKLDSELTQVVTAKRQELLKVINDSVDAAVKSVAEQKKLSVVLSKAAFINDVGGAPVVLYGGTDITDDVLAKLNAAPAAASTKPAATPTKPATTPAATPSKPAATTPATPAQPK